MASTPGCGSTDATASTALENQARSPPPPCGSSSHAKRVSLLEVVQAVVERAAGAGCNDERVEAGMSLLQAKGITCFEELPAYTNFH